MQKLDCAEREFFVFLRDKKLLFIMRKRSARVQSAGDVCYAPDRAERRTRSAQEYAKAHSFSDKVNQNHIADRTACDGEKHLAFP